MSPGSLRGHSGTFDGSGVPGRKARLASIEAADLKSEERLAELYVEAVARGFWPNGNVAVLEFWCLAEKALQDDRRGTPGRLFHGLVKAKDLSRVTDGQEDRALRRMPGNAREELAARAASAADAAAMRASVRAGAVEEAHEDLFGSSALGFLHAVMMMCFLPQKRLPVEQREYVTRHGRAALSIEAGSLANPHNLGEIRRCAVPFGSRARIIVPYVNAYAIRHRTREVDLGRSLRQFLSRLGMSFDGRRGKEVAEQVEAVAAAQIVLGQWHGDRTVTSAGRMARRVTFWMERDASRRLLWEPSLSLSDDYYEVLAERPVPVDMGHLARLARSPRRMDLYAWLSYRTARIPRGRTVRVRAESLRPVFGPAIAAPRLFRQRLAGDLAAVASVYGGFRVRLEGDLLVLERSRPPVPPTRSLAAAKRRAGP